MHPIDIIQKYSTRFCYNRLTIRGNLVLQFPYNTGQINTWFILSRSVNLLPLQAFNILRNLSLPPFYCYYYYYYLQSIYYYYYCYYAGYLQLHI